MKKLDPGLGRNGGGRYRATTTTQKDREEWVAVPVPASERLFRELVDRAREAVTSRAGNERKHRTREWELKNLVRCRCGQLMILNTSRYKGRGLYYYRCRRSSGYGPESCPQTLIRAERIEAPVWEFVYSMLTDPARLRRGLERVSEEARGELSLDPEREIRRLKEDISEAAPAPRVPGPAGGGADDAGRAAGVHRRGRGDARGGRG